MQNEAIQAAVARMRRGDIGGLAVLVENYQVRAIRTAYLITQDHKIAEDIAQAAFIRVYQHIRQYDSRYPFAPWFFRIVANAAVQAARRRDKQTSLDAEPFAGGESVALADLLPDNIPGPEELAERTELRQAVWEALKQLSPEQRAVLVLRYYFDMRENELSKHTNTQSGTVRWRLHAARKQLRVLLHRFKPLTSDLQEDKP